MEASCSLTLNNICKREQLKVTFRIKKLHRIVKQSPEIISHTYQHLIQDRRARSIKRRKDKCALTNVFIRLDHHKNSVIQEASVSQLVDLTFSFYQAVIFFMEFTQEASFHYFFCIFLFLCLWYARYIQCIRVFFSTSLDYSCFFIISFQWRQRGFGPHSVMLKLYSWF